ncbi:MAG: AraC family transcriptional regulator [Paracoccaceae bacterium]|nr:AraC family transcriptional regulator [Paracoccaceae bacterium]
MEDDQIFDAMTVETAPFSLCELAPSSTMAMPKSREATMHYVLSGQGRVLLAGLDPQALGAGDLVLVPAAQSHRLQADDGGFVRLADCQPAALGLMHHRDDPANPVKGLTVLCAHVTLGLRGAGPVIDLLRAPLIETSTQGSAASHALDRLTDELAHPMLGSRAMIRTLLLQCVIDLLRRKMTVGDPSVAWLMALRDRRLWPVLRAMLDAPGAAHSVESLADRAGMSRTRFADRFRDSFGKTPMEVLRGLRLQFAARQLLETDAGIARVAELAGYASRSHFSQQFEEVFGSAPGRFRQHAKPR